MQTETCPGPRSTKMWIYTKSSSVLLAVLCLALTSSFRPGAGNSDCSTSSGVVCGDVSESIDGSCRHRNCSDAEREIDVSFRACQVPGPAEAQSAGAVSIYTFMDVTCNCVAGDITIQVHLPKDVGTADYRMLSDTPNPELLNASRCVSERTGSHSYCIKFTNLKMAGDVNGSELVSEVTSALQVKSSRSCSVIIVFKAPQPTTSPSTGPTSGSPAIMVTNWTLALVLPMLGYIFVKLQEGSLLFSA